MRAATSLRAATGPRQSMAVRIVVPKAERERRGCYRLPRRDSRKCPLGCGRRPRQSVATARVETLHALPDSEAIALRHATAVPALSAAGQTTRNRRRVETAEIGSAQPRSPARGRRQRIHWLLRPGIPIGRQERAGGSVEATLPVGECLRVKRLSQVGHSVIWGAYGWLTPSAATRSPRG